MALRAPFANDARTGQYGFEWLRFILEGGPVQEGVLAGGDLKVTAAAGGGMRVDVAAGTALVKGDSGVPALGLSQGLFGVVNDAAVANAVTLPASDPTNPRVDQICLRVRDSSDLGTGADDATFVYVAGVPTAGATLDTRGGAAPLPADHLRLADVLVPAASSAVAAANIRDRRPWARGAVGSRRTASSYPLSNLAYVDATNLRVRVECSGALLEVAGVATFTGTTQGGIEFDVYDADTNATASFQGGAVFPNSSSPSFQHGVQARGFVLPTPGSHIYDLKAAQNETAKTLIAPILFVREHVGANATNN